MIISDLRHRNLVPLSGCSPDATTTVANVISINEVEIISYLHHRNLVDLHSCCIASPTTTITKVTSSTTSEEKHYTRCCQSPCLHYGVKPTIYDKDIKGTSILLDGEMRARVANFGLARQSREGRSHLSALAVVPRILSSFFLLSLLHVSSMLSICSTVLACFLSLSLMTWSLLWHSVGADGDSGFGPVLQAFIGNTSLSSCSRSCIEFLQKYVTWNFTFVEFQYSLWIL
ncbi:probable receptor-like protein kinase At1g11050 [Dioscorea cayenensis subsp. rotundata]|uniref:Probable receptor-like protein kinase At1g11050 n=1 Tax=Dioscorea cayennensis subsp. rotundata TaxID=55577 RepID=A0AB40B825_DIOCR|nr:probable receptor-like protein kinase At1g11050 [Dioscorea cayenensis subsp. rotundata]